MSVTQSLHTGGEGNVIAGGVDYCITGWDLTETVTTQDVSSTCNYDPGDAYMYSDIIGTMRGAKGSFKFNFDSDNNPFPNIRPGAIVTLKVYGSYEGVNFNFPKVLIIEMPLANQGMENIITVSCNWQSKGRYTTW
jgi:hypothetical protein